MVLPASLPVTLCDRVLRYYVSQKEPTRELVRDATFAVHIYIPGWFFTIKRQCFIKGPVKRMFFLL